MNAKKLPVILDLPPMKACDAGCRDCCKTALPIPEAELARVVLYANERGIAPQSAEPEMCPFYQGGRCAVHDVRPTMCQLFGHVDTPWTTCPRGYNSEPCSDQLVRDAIIQIGPPTRYLHEVLDGDGEACEAAPWRQLVPETMWSGINQVRELSGIPALVRSSSSHPTSEGSPQ